MTSLQQYDRNMTAAILADGHTIQPRDPYYDELAHRACVLLRKQLAEDEMQRRLGAYHCVNGRMVYEEVPFQFSTKEQYKQYVKEHTGIWV